MIRLDNWSEKNGIATVLAALAIVIFCAVVFLGCSQKAPCYDIVGVNPSNQTAVLFDHCQGRVFYQTLPKPSTPRTEGEY